MGVGGVLRCNFPEVTHFETFNLFASFPNDNFIRTQAAKLHFKLFPVHF